MKRYMDVAAVAADPAVEAVFICSPAHLHLDQAFECARAGKAIFVEKPLGSDLSQARELVSFCEERGIPHGHGFGARSSDLSLEIRRLLDSGVCGEIVSASAATMHTGGWYLPADNWRFAAGRNPGGPLYQCGIHKIDLLRFLFGDGRWLAGWKSSTITPVPTDDAYVLLGRFGSVTVTLHSHYVCSYRHSLEIYGTKGAIFASEYPVSLVLKTTDVASGEEKFTDLTASIPPRQGELDDLRDFAASVRERRQPRVSGRDGFAALELVYSATQVARADTNQQF